MYGCSIHSLDTRVRDGHGVTKNIEYLPSLPKFDKINDPGLERFIYQIFPSQKQALITTTALRIYSAIAGA